MIFAKIDGSANRNIVGFETGNRQQFDQRHGGDSQWVFLDSDKILLHVQENSFLMTPTQFRIDPRGNVQMKPNVVPRPKPTYRYLVDEDNTLLQDSDGVFLIDPY